MAVIVAVLCAALAFQAGAQETRVPEYSIKAAFLRQFLNFVAWPDSVTQHGDGAIVIGIIGGDPFGSALNEAFAADEADRRHYRVVRAKTVEDALRSHLLFIAAPGKAEALRILDVVRTRPILTVGEQPWLTDCGGIIRFSLVNDRVRFAIDRDNAERAGIQVSSKLLTLSRGGH